MKKLILALCLSFPIFTYSAEPQRIPFNEFNKIIEGLASECTAKGMSNFSGFCLSQKYDDHTKTSITVALQLTSFEMFYRKCEHSDFPNGKDLLSRVLNIEETKKFLEEMKPQKKAQEINSNYFDYCKTKEENNLAVSNKLKWFEYMTNKYSNNVKDEDTGGNKPILQLSSNQPANKVVDCILAQYKGPEFVANGLMKNDGSISVELMAPERVALATVSNSPYGSTTVYINIKNSSNKVIPRADTFDNAVNKCNSAQVSFPEYFVGTFVDTVPKKVGGTIADTKFLLNCSKTGSCFVKIGENVAGKYSTFMPVTNLQYAAYALSYAKEHNNVAVNSALSWQANNLKPLLSSSSVIEACVDLRGNSLPQGYMLLCKLDDDPWKKSTVLLMGTRMSNCGELFCRYEIFPLFRE